MPQAYRWLLTLFYFLYTKSKNDRKKHSTENNSTDLVSRRSWAQTAHIMGKGRFSQHQQTPMQLMRQNGVSGWWMSCGEVESILKNIHLPNHAFKLHLFKNKLYIQISPPKCVIYASAINLRHPNCLVFCWWGIDFSWFYFHRGQSRNFQWCPKGSNER